MRCVGVVVALRGCQPGGTGLGRAVFRHNTRAVGVEAPAPQPLISVP